MDVGASTPAFIAGMVRITSFAEANEILRDADFGNGRFEEESLPFRGRTLLEIDGDEHRRRRKTEIPLVARDMLERHEREIFDPVIERCLQEADADRRPDGVVATDLARLSHRMFLQVAAAVIGLDGVDTPERTDLLEHCMYRLNAGFDVKFSTRDHAEVIAEGLAAKEDFREHFVGPSLARRAELVARCERGELAERELPTDLLTLMLRHHGHDPDPDLTTREATLYMAGATDTTSNAVNHAIAELDRWLEAHPEDREQLESAEFLRGVCNEALRIHQNVTALARRAKEDVTLASGRFVPKGEQVAVDLVQANLDTEVFGADAAEFNPWRRVPASAAPPYGLAFGTGRHVCIGRPLVTPISGGPTTKDEGERLLMKVVRRLIEAGVQLDRSTPPRFAPTAEDVYESLPVLMTSR